jgi:hypothetical protein
MEDEAMHDSVDSLSDNNLAYFALPPNDIFTTSEELFDSEESFGNNVVPDTTEAPVESEFSSFMTREQCITSLMYLLDSIKCSDYAFKSIMEWAHKCFEAGFD